MRTTSYSGVARELCSPKTPSAARDGTCTAQFSTDQFAQVQQKLSTLFGPLTLRPALLFGGAAPEAPAHNTQRHMVTAQRQVWGSPRLGALDGLHGCPQEPVLRCHLESLCVKRVVNYFQGSLQAVYGKSGSLSGRVILRLTPEGVTQGTPTFLAPGTGFVKDDVSTDGGARGGAARAVLGIQFS